MEYVVSRPVGRCRQHSSSRVGAHRVTHAGPAADQTIDRPEADGCCRHDHARLPSASDPRRSTRRHKYLVRHYKVQEFKQSATMGELYESRIEVPQVRDESATVLVLLL